MPVYPPKIVQFRRGTTEEHQDLIGAEGELTVDLDKKTLVVHDGETVGGFPLRRDDALQTRQQFIEFKTAVVQNNVAFLGLSTGTYPPTAVGVSTVSGYNMAVARFDALAEQALYGRFAMPYNWPGTPILCKILWRTVDTVNPVAWSVEVGGLHDGHTIESFQFDTPISAFCAPSTNSNGLKTSILTITEEHFSHIEPSGDFYFRVCRGFDNSPDPADMVSVRFNLDRRSV